MAYPKWINLPSFVKNHRMFKKDLVKGGETVEVNPEHANLVSSEFYRKDGVVYHRPLIDLDIPAVLIPSSTIGHSHLYIDKVLTDVQYGALLVALAKCGILQQGIIDHQWVPEGRTMLRMPGDKKEPGSMSSGGPVSKNGIPWAPVLEPLEDQIIEMGKVPGVNVNKPEHNTITLEQIQESIATSEKMFNDSVELDAWVKPETMKVGEGLTDEVETAMMVFNSLAAIASNTGLRPEEIIEAWKKFSD